MDRYLSSESLAVYSPNRQKVKAKRLSVHGKGSSGKRKSLQVLQPSANHQSMLVGLDGVIATTANPKKKSGKRKVVSDSNEGRPRKLSRSSEDSQENDTTQNIRGSKSNKTGEKMTDKGGKNRFNIYEDSSSSSSESEQEKTCKTAEEEAHELMIQEAVPDSYWKQLAEQRREALEDTLRENEGLHEEVAELKAKNERLQIMADQAEYLASVVQELMGEENEKDKEEEDDSARSTPEVQDEESSQNEETNEDTERTEEEDSNVSDGDL